MRESTEEWKKGRLRFFLLLLKIIAAAVADLPAPPLPIYLQLGRVAIAVHSDSDRRLA